MSNRKLPAKKKELPKPSDAETAGSKEPVDDVDNEESEMEDTLLEEKEMMAMDDESKIVLTKGVSPKKGAKKGKPAKKSSPKKSENKNSPKKQPGMILVPRIMAGGLTVERLKTRGGKSSAENVKMIAVKDDRVGELKKLASDNYLQLIMPLHVELLKLQNYVKEKGLRVVVLFEGRDAAGKGGTIKRFIEHMNPRGCRVVALDKPTEKEKGQWYFQRYVKHLPTAGEIVLFDRSWYNRAMVERVMGFCENDEVREFLRSVPEFERMLGRSGIILLKYYFSVSKKEQLHRFNKRLDDPLKQWKLSPVDLESQDKWEEYKRAKEDMFFYTSTGDCPWVIIKSDEKKRARINAMRHFLGRINYKKDYPEMLGVDKRFVKTVKDEMSHGHL